jgi:hypothetical protein
VFGGFPNYKRVKIWCIDFSMAKPDNNVAINENLDHRGVRFGIKRVSPADEAPQYRWTIYPRSGLADSTHTGHSGGPRAFLQAYKAAQLAIDHWLASHPEDNATK